MRSLAGAGFPLFSQYMVCSFYKLLAICDKQETDYSPVPWNGSKLGRHSPRLRSRRLGPHPRLLLHLRPQVAFEEPICTYLHPHRPGSREYGRTMI